jgi:TonB family protein
MTARLALLVAVLVLCLANPTLAQQDLAAARELYTSAKYEEALVALERVKDPATALATEQYRASCLLALNRRGEAEKAIETIVGLDPFYLPAEDDVAPWIRTAFKEARRKALPAALQRAYTRGKDAYTRKDAEEAMATFAVVLRLLDDPDLSVDKSAQADMRMVVQGFVDLLHAAPAAVPPAKPAPAAPADASPTEPRTTDEQTAAQPPPSVQASAAAVEPLFDASSGDVIPPVPLKRDVPTWPYGPRPAPGTAVVVEIVVRATGTIESIAVRQGAGRFYDQQVIQAAQNWLYRPATRLGQPVRYRLLVKVVIAAPPSEPPQPR